MDRIKASPMAKMPVKKLEVAQSKQMSILFGLLLLFFNFSSVESLRLCIRKHHVVVNADFLQRVELPTAERCVERCIENMRFCLAAQFSMPRHGQLGMCILYTSSAMKTDDSVQPEANLDPVSTVYEIAHKCPPLFSSGDMSHRLSKLHRMALEGGDAKLMKDMLAKARQADSFFPEGSERVGGEDGFALQRSDRFATMKSIDKSRVKVHFQETDNGEDGKDSPKNPFTTEPSSEGREEAYNSGAELFPGGSSHLATGGDMQAIQPVEVLHQGRKMGGGSEFGRQDTYSTYQQRQQLPQVPAAQFSLSHDSAPCPARLGDPCAPPPSRPCPSSDCYSIPRAASPEWSPWSSYSLCSATCGQGEKFRMRSCTNGGRDCDGPSKEVESCQLAECPLWSEWGEFSGCQISCGQGRERRTRKCLNGLFCPGPSFEDRSCDRGPCPHWSLWEPWSECTKSCGIGETMRKRECVDGEGCEGVNEERLLCNQQACPHWLTWTSWTECDNTCGQESFRLRNRVCQYRGIASTDCEGPAQDQLPCPLIECPTWLEWGPWSDCSTTCGQGSQARRRKCEGDRSIGCTGPDKELKFCQIAACPYYTEWSAWTGCSVTCGKGICERHRKCITDEFLNLPSLAEIESTAEVEAERARSKMTRSVGNFSKEGLVRNKASGGGLTNAAAADQCDGPSVDRKVCDAGPCCSLTSWTEWSPCIGCGQRAISKRSRQCVPDGSQQEKLPPSLFSNDPNRYRPLSGSYSAGPHTALGIDTLSALQPIVPVNGRKKRQAFSLRLQSQCHCDGDSFETRPCPQMPCEEPVSCSWSSWGSWCGCEKCRSGKEVRRRYCDRPGSASPGRQRPFLPEASCSCRGRDTEERECIVQADCLNAPIYSKSVDSYVVPRGREGLGRGLGREGGRVGGEMGGERGQREDYIPIRSKLGEVQLKSDEEEHEQGQGENYLKKDSVDSFMTTSFPYPVCHWSTWSQFSRCDSSSGARERKRFCIGKLELVGGCECRGNAVDEQKCDLTEDDNQAEDSELTTIENKLENSLEDDFSDLKKSSNRKENEVFEELPVKECEFTNWSQFSICTVTCGKGVRLRKRRCPCGENKCGPGIDTDTEGCVMEKCGSRAKEHPSFALQPAEEENTE